MRRLKRLDGDPSRAAVALLLGEVTVLLVLALVGRAPQQPSPVAEAANRSLVRELQITDLAFWSEASYCRHLSQTDLFAPFADHPAAFEHFPSGSLVPVPKAVPEGAVQVGRAVP